MSIDTYGELVTAASALTDRTDVERLIPTLLGVAESKINRRLRVRQMERTVPGVIVNNEAELPIGWLETAAMWNGDDKQATITAKPRDFVRANFGASRPTMVAVDGLKWVFNCAAGTFWCGYYERIPALTDKAPTNWLLTTASDLYLWALLAELELYALNDDRAATWLTRSDELIKEMNHRDMQERYSGTLEVT